MIFGRRILYQGQKPEGMDCDSRPVSDVYAEEPVSGSRMLNLDAGDRLRAEDVRRFTAGRGLFENALFTAAFAYTLAKFNGTKECFFCAAHHGRRDPRLAASVGMFVRTMPMACAFEESMSPAELTAAVIPPPQP